MHTLLNDILLEAIRLDASKINIEPNPKICHVRFRAGMELFEFDPELSLETHKLLSHTIKELAGIDLAEKTISQDGFIELDTPELKGTYIVSVSPGLAGERICITPYGRRNVDFELEKLGMQAESLDIWNKQLQAFKPGMIVLAGPTNSGKSTTVYSALLEMRNKNLTVATAEYEPRCQLEGVHQMVPDFHRGLTFAEICRSYLRSDVDVIFLSELPDYETVEIALKAVLDNNKTVIGGIHCQDTISALERFRYMGVDLWLLVESISILQGQRLLRTLCPHCKEEVHVPAKTLIDAGMDPLLAEITKVHRPKGCTQCANIGYKGLTLAAETLKMTDAFAQGMLEGKGRYELKGLAIEEGMDTLRQSALQKMAEGLTSLEDVLLRTPHG